MSCCANERFGCEQGRKRECCWDSRRRCRHQRCCEKREGAGKRRGGGEGGTVGRVGEGGLGRRERRRQRRTNSRWRKNRRGADGKTRGAGEREARDGGRRVGGGPPRGQGRRRKGQSTAAPPPPLRRAVRRGEDGARAAGGEGRRAARRGGARAARARRGRDAGAHTMLDRIGAKKPHRKRYIAPPCPPLTP